MGDMEIIWHYTVGVYLADIFRDGLKPTHELLQGMERPAVWFTTRTDWEPTCNKRLIRHSDGKARRLTRTETEGHLRGLFRIGVPASVAPHTWGHHLRNGRIRNRIAKELAADARSWGSDPFQWRLTYEPVPVSAFVAAQMWYHGSWGSVDSVDHHDMNEYLDAIEFNLDEGDW